MHGRMPGPDIYPGITGRPPCKPGEQQFGKCCISSDVHTIPGCVSRQGGECAPGYARDPCRRGCCVKD